MPELAKQPYTPGLREAVEQLEIALPAPSDRLEQDEEWVVAHTPGGWKKVRLHDYADVFSIPGLYEKWVYGVLGCTSPAKVRDMLAKELHESGVQAASVPVLDLGAGNGCVAETLRSIGFSRFVGVDIHEEAALAAERDRPGLYDDYVVGDLTRPTPQAEQTLDRYEFGCLACVAALGFGDVPTEVFVEAFNRVRDRGLVAFTIKTDFLSPDDKSGFSTLIRSMIADGALTIRQRERYVHRVDAAGNELRYEAIVGRKIHDAA